MAYPKRHVLKGDIMENQCVNSSMGFCGWLTLLFIALQLTGYINWSWWWVWSPVLIPVGVCLAVLAACLVVMGIAHLIGGKS